MRKYLGFPAIFLLLVFACPLHADEDHAARTDAIQLLEIGPFPLDVIPLCKGYLVVDERLLKAIRSWNQRNRAVLDRVVQVIKWSGGISDQDMDELRARGNSRARQAVDAQTDKSAYCNGIVDQMNAGSFDLDRSPATAAMAKRIMTTKVE